jgi:Right handed beta helix region
MSTLYSIPGIYNVLDSTFSGGMVPGPLGNPVQNAKALQSAIDHAQTDLNGGIVLIPTVGGGAGQSGEYLIQGPSGAGNPIIIIPDTPGGIMKAQPLLICGTGGGTTLLIETNNATLFSVTGNNGLTFQDLTIIYNQLPEAPLTGACFSLTDGLGYILFRVTIVDCEKAVAFNNLDQGYMLQCSILYTSAYPNQDLVGIDIEKSAEVWVDQCLLQFGGTHIANTQVAVQIGQSSWSRITQTEIQNFYTGIELGHGSGTSKGTMITNTHVVSASGGVGLFVGIGVYDIKIIGSRFENQTTNTAQNIVVNPGSAGNASVDTVIFDSCVSTGSVDYGLQIEGGQNIQVLGGTYSGNTTAGVAITGAAAEVQIHGVSCIGMGDAGGAGPQGYGIYVSGGTDLQIMNVNCSYNGTTSQIGSGIFVLGDQVSSLQIIGATCKGSAGSHQAYGITLENVVPDVIIAGCTLTGNLQWGLNLVQVSNVTVDACDLYNNGTGGVLLNGGETHCTNVFIRNCNITGYSGGISSAINSLAVLTNIAVTNCAGYNDLGYFLTNSPPSGTFSGASFRYWGPTAFYVVGSGGVTIDSHSTGLNGGGFTLGIGESASISGAPTSFLMVGR